MKLLRSGLLKQILVFGILTFPFLSVAQDNDNKEEEVFGVTIEQSASFNGGDLFLFHNWVMNNIEYPKKALKKHIQGKVIVRFSINSKGLLCDITILKGVDPVLDNEVIRVLKKSPIWIPAKLNGESVKQQFTIPVNFKMED